jgi:hypothetical protein
MEEAPENGKESPHSAPANGMNEFWSLGWLLFLVSSQDGAST